MELKQRGAKTILTLTAMGMVLQPVSLCSTGQHEAKKSPLTLIVRTERMKVEDDVYEIMGSTDLRKGDTCILSIFAKGKEETPQYVFRKVSSLDEALQLKEALETVARDVCTDNSDIIFHKLPFKNPHDSLETER